MSTSRIRYPDNQFKQKYLILCIEYISKTGNQYHQFKIYMDYGYNFIFRFSLKLSYKTDVCSSIEF